MKKVNSRKVFHPEAEGFTRYPDTGPVNIQDYGKYLKSSKAAFEERWEKSLVYKEVLSDFYPIKLLGTGSFGDVVLVRHYKSEKIFAMKVIGKKKVVMLNEVEHIKNEKKVLQCLNSPLTVYMKCYFHDNSYIYFVMPYVPLELFGVMEEFKKFNELEARFFASQVVLALEYLHYLGLIYRDLKLENILVDENGYVKLTDFGFCKRLKDQRTYTMCGTPDYIAPEVLISKGYGYPVDWWGCGVLLYELVAGNTPFQADAVLGICKNILRCNYKMPRHFSSDLKDLVSNLLMTDLTKRFGNLKNGVNDIKNHRWFKTVDWMQVANRNSPAPVSIVKKLPGVLNALHPIIWRPPEISMTDKYSDAFNEF